MGLKDNIANTPVRKAFLQLSTANVWMFVFQLLSLFIMTKYYSKDQIAEFSIFLVLTFLCSKLANLKLFEAIIREPKQEESDHIFNSSLSLGIYGAISIGIILFLLSQFGVHMNILYKGEFRYNILLILLIVHLVTSSVIPVISSGLLKHEELLYLSRGRIVKAIIQVIVLALAIEYGQFNGLIWALVASAFLQTIYYIIISKKIAFDLVSVKEVFITLKSNKDIIAYTLPTSLLLSLRENGIVQIIQFSFGEGALAAYAIADRILRLPSVIFGSAATETLYKYGSDSFYKQSKAIFLKQIIRGIKRFSMFFLFMAIVCAILAYPVLNGLFEDKWEVTSELLLKYSLWIVPFSLVAMLRNVPVMLKEQKTYFILELLLFFVIIAGLSIVSRTGSFADAMYFKFLAEALIMIVIVFAIFRLVKRQAAQ